MRKNTNIARDAVHDDDDDDDDDDDIDDNDKEAEEEEEKQQQQKVVVFTLPSRKHLLFLAFVEDNATMSSLRCFENHVSYFVQNRRK